MKTVRIKDRLVVEIIPEEASPVDYWYGEEFAKECIEAPDDVAVGCGYNPLTKTFYKPGKIPTMLSSIQDGINSI